MNSNYEICQAHAEDIAAVAAIFTASFTESVLHTCGQIPKPQAMRDIFSFIYETEPQAVFVAKNFCGKTIGYLVSLADLTHLWLNAFLGGYIFKWCWRWLTGQYGFGLYPIKIIVLNKAHFFRSALFSSKTANARILSIAIIAEARNLGIGKNLIAAGLKYFENQKITRVRLEVRPDNKEALKIYHYFGFIPAGKTYDSQGSWLIMLKEMGE